MARRRSTLEPHAQAPLCYFTCPAPPRDICGHSGPRHLLLRREAAEGGTSHFSCPRALVMGTRWLGGDIALSERETVEARPVHTGPKGGGRPGGPRARRPGSATAGSFVHSGRAKAALPPPQQCSLCPEARDPLYGALPPPWLFWPGGSLPLPTLRDTPWDLGTKGQGFLQPDK